jgi:hypothetical protein
MDRWMNEWMMSTLLCLSRSLSQYKHRSGVYARVASKGDDGDDDDDDGDDDEGDDGDDGDDERVHVSVK